MKKIERNKKKLCVRFAEQKTIQAVTAFTTENEI